MKKINDGHWKHKGCDIFKSGGCYISGWNTMTRPFQSDTLDGMRKLINRYISSV